MASKSEALSQKVERVQRSIQKLPAVASDLNKASDRLGKSVAELDGVLKKYSLGVPTWVHFSTSSEDDGLAYQHEDIGYAKIGGRWGISIRTIEGDERLSADKVEQWQFNEAPRLLRVRAIEWIPELLEKLLEDAGNMTREITEKADEVDVLSAGIREASVEKPRSPGRVSIGDLMRDPSILANVTPEQIAAYNAALGKIVPSVTNAAIGQVTKKGEK